MIKALIFDFDGLILDTEMSEYRSWQEIYSEHGHELPFKLWVEAIGTVEAFDPYEHLYQLLLQWSEGPQTLNPRPELEEKRHRRDAEITAGMPVMPGVRALLEAAQRQGLQMAIASSSPHAWVDGHLARLKLAPYFDVVVCRDDVGGRAKPDPAVYLLVLEKLGVNAAEVIVFEDSQHGVTAAKAAGLYTVAVPNELTRFLDLSAADRMVDSLQHVTLSDLLAAR